MFTNTLFGENIDFELPKDPAYSNSEKTVFFSHGRHETVINFMALRQLSL